VDGAVHCDDGSLPPDWPVLVFCNLMVEAFAKLGTTSHAAMFGGKYLEEAGFVNIQHRTAKLPYGTWPKDRCVFSVCVMLPPLLVCSPPGYRLCPLGRTTGLAFFSSLALPGVCTCVYILTQVPPFVGLCDW
jgi:hypothetical protein